MIYRRHSWQRFASLRFRALESHQDAKAPIKVAFLEAMDIEVVLRRLRSRTFSSNPGSGLEHAQLR